MSKPDMQLRLTILAETRPAIKDASNSACNGCPAFCCYDLAWQIARPTTPQEIADATWRLQFDKVKYVIQDQRWLILIEGKCIYLTDESKCAIYETRPQQCRDHVPPYCARYIRRDDLEITTPDELLQYLAVTGSELAEGESAHFHCPDKP